MKKLLSCLLTASIAVMVLPVQAYAENPIRSVKINHLEYWEYETYYALEGVEEDTISVVIPTEIDGKPVILAETHGDSELYHLNVFQNSNLKEILTEDDNPYYTSIDGVLFYMPEEEVQQLVAYPCAKEDTDYTVPEGTTAILSKAFCDCQNLEFISFSDSVDTNHAGMFYRCPALREIHGTITHVGSDALWECPEICYLHFGKENLNLSSFELNFSSLKTVLIDEDTATKNFVSSGNVLKELSVPKADTIKISHCQNLEILHLRNDSPKQTIQIIDCPVLKEIIFEDGKTADSVSSLKLTGLPSLEKITYYGTEAYRAEIKMPLFCNHFTVYCSNENTALKNSCEKYQIPFQILSDEYSIGDVTGDSKADILDVIAINKAVLGKESLTSEQIKAVDFNGNDKPDASDALTLMKYIVGLIETLI